MKPVLVLQHMVADGPSYLATWLAGQGVPVVVRCTEAGEEFPRSIEGHSALAILGGTMSANDDLPSLRHAEQLILEAMGRGVPVIGHCLGGQLMARALGASVTRSPRPEVGWHRLQWDDAAVPWFGNAAPDSAPPEVFQWHYEAFTLPAGAQHLAGNAACPHQAFSIGPHLAMQFHVELDAAKLEAWCDWPDVGHGAAQRSWPTHVQRPAQMREAAPARLAAQQRLAAAAYGRWLRAADG